MYPGVWDALNERVTRPKRALQPCERCLVAQLHGTAKHHARWRELTEDEQTAAAGELRELAGDRPDLLAHVVGILEGTSEGQLNEPGRAGCVAVPRGRGRPGGDPGLDRGRSAPESCGEQDAVSRAACAAGEAAS
jgi:hypothetical protein